MSSIRSRRGRSLRFFIRSLLAALPLDRVPAVVQLREDFWIAMFDEQIVSGILISNGFNDLRIVVDPISGWIEGPDQNARFGMAERVDLAVEVRFWCFVTQSLRSAEAM